jgi:hypothetical protein
MRSLGVSDSKVWPKEWKDDDENAGDNLDTFLTDVRRQEAYYDSLSSARRQVASDHNIL